MPNFAYGRPDPTTLLTAADYESLPEIPGFRDELIEGERVLAPMAKASHTVVIENVEEILKTQVRGARVVRESGWLFQSTEELDNVPGPDLMVLSTEDYDRSVHRGGWFEGRPLFVVEVVSPSERNRAVCRRSDSIWRRAQEQL